jgi:phenylacetate-CoA ligase
LNKWKKRRFGGIYSSKLTEFKSRESFSKQQWYDYQTIELRKLLLHAFDTVPFYNQKYKENGIDLNFLKKIKLEEINKLPILEKEDLRKFGETSLISSKRERGGFFFLVVEVLELQQKFYFQNLFIKDGMLHLN